MMAARLERITRLAAAGALAGVLACSHAYSMAYPDMPLPPTTIGGTESPLPPMKVDQSQDDEADQGSLFLEANPTCPDGNQADIRDEHFWCGNREIKPEVRWHFVHAQHHDPKEWNQN
jgi:hypothetical protein